MYLILATDVNWSPKQQSEFLAEANKQADRLTVLIRDLLDMSRIESGKWTLNNHRCLRNEILDSISPVLLAITPNCIY
jgi:K+-sensing histidine kinase KdpD